MNDSKTSPGWVAEKDDQPLSPSTLYDPMSRADLTVPPMMHPELTRLHAEIARLQAELSEERDESLWRFWSEKANELATKNAEIRAELDAVKAERDSALTQLSSAEDAMDTAVAAAWANALEDAAKVAENRWTAWADSKRHGKPEVTCDVTACENIAAAIRAMIEQEDKPINWRSDSEAIVEDDGHPMGRDGA